MEPQAAGHLPLSMASLKARQESPAIASTHARTSPPRVFEPGAPVVEAHWCPKTWAHCDGEAWLAWLRKGAHSWLFSQNFEDARAQSEPEAPPPEVAPPGAPLSHPSASKSASKIRGFFIARGSNTGHRRPEPGGATHRGQPRPPLAPASGRPRPSASPRRLVKPAHPFCPFSSASRSPLPLPGPRCWPGSTDFPLPTLPVPAIRRNVHGLSMFHTATAPLAKPRQPRAIRARAACASARPPRGGGGLRGRRGTRVRCTRGRGTRLALGLFLRRGRRRRSR